MLEYVKTFDLLGSVTQFLQERRQSLGIPGNVPLRPRLVNQEKGGVIIYTWNDLTEDVKAKKGPVTHVGVYDTATQKHKVLWIYNQAVKIVSCSLNRERTLLGFTVITKQDGGQDGKPKDVYQAFLAELKSQETRVFSLNLLRYAFIKVQFLYPDINPNASSGSGSSASSRQTYMLVMLHKESIGMYQISMARIGDGGIMMSGQPSTEQIVRKFVWCQWDAQNQRLYYIHSVRQSSSHTNSVGHKLSAIQFHTAGKFDNMVDVPINFPFPFIRSSTRVTYTDIPLHTGIPDMSVNAVVLSQTNGNLCFCYQEPVPPLKSKHTTSPASPQPEDEGNQTTTDVNYYICMVHHAKTLHGCATSIPRTVLVGKKIFFQWFGEYLTATMPGVFSHVLNVSLEFEPCHHILLHNQDIHAVTKTETPSTNANPQSQPRVPGSSDITTSTDTSDTAAVQHTTTLDSKASSRSLVQERQFLQGSASETNDSKTENSSEPHSSESAVSKSLVDHEKRPGVTSGAVHSSNIHSLKSTISKSQGQGIHVSSQDHGVSIPSSHTVSPRLCLGSDHFPEAVSVVDGACFKLGVPLVHCFGFFREAGSLGPNLYDGGSGCVWRLAFNPECLVKSFKAAYWSTQLAILHYLLMLRTRDIFNIKQVFEALTADPTAPENTIFLSEYLVASTFASMRKKVDKEVMVLLNFTASDTFRGQFERNAQGERLARITYITLDSVNISTKGSQERRRRSSEDSWDLLRRSLRLKQIPPPSRFSHEHVLKALQKDIDNNGSHKKWTWVNRELDESFFDGMHTVNLTDVPTLSNRPSVSSSTSEPGGGGGRHSRTETVLGATPLFLQAFQSAKAELRKKVVALTEQLLVSHLSHHLKKESRIKAQNIAREYVTCQMQQCQQLCHLLWSIHMDGETMAYEQLLPSLKETGTDSEYRLFQVYERVFLVTQDIAFPRTPGLSSYFTSLGFKCLTPSVFLQYVDRGILQLTPDFVLRLLHDLPDGDDNSNAEIKFHIISRLPKPFAEDCFQRWHHPVILQSAAQRQVAQILQEGQIMARHRSDGSTDSEQRIAEVRSRSATTTDSHSGMSADTMSFKPLTIFIKHLEDTALEVQRQKPGSTSLMYDTNIIEEAALAFTRHNAHCDLSTMNF